MQTGLYVALSSQMALEKRLNTLADNVANSNTVGFRGTEVKFNQVLGERSRRKSPMFPKARNFSTPITALLRAPALRSILPSGARPGFRSTLQAGGADTRRAVHADGDRRTRDHQGVSGARCRRRADTVERRSGLRSPSAADGAIHQNGVQVALLGSMKADFSKGFMRYDNSAVMPAAPPEPVVDRFGVGVMQGFLEESNVNAISGNVAAHHDYPALRQHHRADA